MAYASLPTSMGCVQKVQTSDTVIRLLLHRADSQAFVKANAEQMTVMMQEQALDVRDWIDSLEIL